MSELSFSPNSISSIRRVRASGLTQLGYWKRSNGFTLIELMITVAIVAILAVIAYPTYVDQVRKSRRTEARSMLLEVASRQERFFTTSRPSTYAEKMTGLGYDKDPQPTGDTGAANAWYQVTITTPAGCDIEECFVLEAEPLRDQKKDTLCGKLTLNSLGQKGESGSGDVADCW